MAAAILKVSKFNNLELQNVPTIVGKWRLLTYEVSRSISYHLEVNFASNPPSPLEFPGPLTPPPPWNFQFPPWWGYGYFLELHNTGIFLRSLKLCRESTTQQVLLVSNKKIGGDHTFFRDNKASIWKNTPYIALYFTAFYNNCGLIISKKCMFTPRGVLKKI